MPGTNIYQFLEGRQPCLDALLMRNDHFGAYLNETDASITVAGRDYDPFDTAGINAALAGSGLFYGAGYAYSLKPAFLLAEVAAERRIEGLDVFYLGRELARDLLTLPALVQDNAVVFRREAARLYLWDQILYIKPSGRPALHIDARPKTS